MGLSSQPSSSSRTSVPQYFQTMSPVPAPAPTNAPASYNEQSNAHADEESRDTDLPRPLLRLELRDLRHDEITTFLSNVDASSDIANQVDNVTRLLYYPSAASTSIAAAPTTALPRSRPAPRKVHIPGTRSVTLILRSMDGVAYTTGLDLDDDHKEIHMSLSYVSHVSSSNKGDKSKIRHELLGVICHELVHCFQWNALGTAPGGLIEGIADWVRLKAGLGAAHWKKEHTKWDAGYQTTGYFLDWIESSYGEGSVRKLNQTLRDTEYDEDKFWTSLFGQSVDRLWELYGSSLREDAKEPSRAEVVMSR